jgi:hypothetical protein
VTASDTAAAQWDADYRTAAAAAWARYTTDVRYHGIAFYEGWLSAYQWWLRTGDPVAWYRANRMTAAYVAWLRTTFRLTTTGGLGVSPWLSNTEALALHYVATGDPSIRALVGQMAENLGAQTRDGFKEFPPDGNGFRLGGPRGDDRGRARTLMAFMDAQKVAAPFTPYYTNSALAKGIRDVLSTQHANGSFGGTTYLGGQKNYMVGLLLTALVRYYDEVTPDPKVATAVRRAVAYAWATQWVDSAQGFKYVSVDSTSEGVGQTKPQPSLNGLLVPGFAFAAATAPDSAERATYRRALDKMASGVRTNRRNWSTWVEQFDQAYYRVMNALARAR